MGYIPHLLTSKKWKQKIKPHSIIMKADSILTTYYLNKVHWFCFKPKNT